MRRIVSRNTARENGKSQKNKTNITDKTVNEIKNLAENADQNELEKWLIEEMENKERITVINLLEEKLNG